MTTRAEAIYELGEIYSAAAEEYDGPVVEWGVQAVARAVLADVGRYREAFDVKEAVNVVMHTGGKYVSDVRIENTSGVGVDVRMDYDLDTCVLVFAIEREAW